ncbi:MAG: glycogen debranching enzyme, partial [Chloroflexota bacterium]
EPEQSINFVTCHDGFTLNDLVTYNEKHNEANGEDNHDGHNHNLSWNHGHEGPTDDPEIEELRNRQIKNFLAITLLSLGTPMLLMGDEVRRTQHGNNNAYCQDNEISWFDWSLVDKHADILRFVQRLIRVRLNMDVVRGDSATSLNQFLQEAKIQWHGVKLNKPDWGKGSHTLAMTIQCLRDTCAFHFMLNMYWEALTFELPRPAGGRSIRWRRVLDTYLPSPDDISEPASAPPVITPDYTVGPRSVVALVSQSEPRRRAKAGRR